MAGGVDVVYPAENAVLAQEIAEQGLRLSEQPMHREPQARHFPMRNRIISGLARAVVVVEAAAKSGSLITARTALDQGRDVLAVPGHPFDARAGGCNMLIRDGAILVRGAADVIEALAREAARRRARGARISRARPARSARAPDAGRDLGAARPDPRPAGPEPAGRGPADPRPRHAVGQVAPELVSLELDGRIRRQPGGLLSLVV
jgi:DNA processing protein